MTQVYITQCGSFTATHGHGGTLAEESHVHTFKYEITFYGPLNAEGYLIDFRELHNVLDKYVSAPLNGTDLNTRLRNPTTEELAIWIFNTVRKHFPQIYSVKLAEEPDRWVVYKGGGY